MFLFLVEFFLLLVASRPEFFSHLRNCTLQDGGVQSGTRVNCLFDSLSPVFQPLCRIRPALFRTKVRLPHCQPKSGLSRVMVGWKVSWWPWSWTTFWASTKVTGMFSSETIGLKFKNQILQILLLFIQILWTNSLRVWHLKSLRKSHFCLIPYFRCSDFWRAKNNCRVSLRVEP